MFCVDDEMVCSNIYQVGGCVAVTIADRQVGEESFRAGGHPCVTVFLSILGNLCIRVE